MFRKLTGLVYGLGLGAGLMYMFDPDQGNRRRALVRDQAMHLLNEAEGAVNSTSQDLNNRIHGVKAEFESLVTNKEISDEVLAERIRAKMGRLISHPGAVAVTVDEGHVTLKGPILAYQAPYLLAAVNSMSGVTGVSNELEAHESPGNIPGLQGGKTPPILREGDFSPTGRLMVGLLGGALTLYGVGRRGIIGTALSVLGMGIIGRGMTTWYSQ